MTAPILIKNNKKHTKMKKKKYHTIGKVQNTRQNRRKMLNK